MVAEYAGLEDGAMIIEMTTDIDPLLFDLDRHAMLALYPSPSDAEALVQPGGEPAEKLHCTICVFKPPMTPSFVRRIHASAREAIARWHGERLGAMTGEIAGTGRFNLQNGGTVNLALPDIPALPELRDRLMEALERWGAHPASTHGYTPHISLQYHDGDVPVPEVAKLPMLFDRFHLVIGDNVAATYPLVEQMAMTPVDVSEDRDALIDDRCWGGMERAVMDHVLPLPSLLQQRRPNAAALELAAFVQGLDDCMTDEHAKRLRPLVNAAGEIEAQVANATAGDAELIDQAADALEADMQEYRTRFLDAGIDKCFQQYFSVVRDLLANPALTGALKSTGVSLSRVQGASRQVAHYYKQLQKTQRTRDAHKAAQSVPPRVMNQIAQIANWKSYDAFRVFKLDGGGQRRYVILPEGNAWRLEYVSDSEDQVLGRNLSPDTLASIAAEHYNTVVSADLMSEAVAGDDLPLYSYQSDLVAGSPGYELWTGTWVHDDDGCVAIERPLPLGAGADGGSVLYTLRPSWDNWLATAEIDGELQGLCLGPGGEERRMGEVHLRTSQTAKRACGRHYNRLWRKHSDPVPTS